MFEGKTCTECLSIKIQAEYLFLLQACIFVHVTESNMPYQWSFSLMCDVYVWVIKLGAKWNKSTFLVFLITYIEHAGSELFIFPYTGNGHGWVYQFSWWHQQMETFSAFLALCAGNSPVTCKFPAQRPVTRSFDVFFDLRLNKRLSKQSWGWWSETPLRSLWRHCNVCTTPITWLFILSYICKSNILWTDFIRNTTFLLKFNRCHMQIPSGLIQHG